MVAKKSKNCYISNMAITITNIYHVLIEYGYVYPADYDIPEQKFRRYIGNIKFMLDEYHLTNFYDIVYDSLNARYVLIKKNEDN